MLVEKRVNEFQFDENGEIEIPLTEDIVKAIEEMVQDFDCSENKSAITEVLVNRFLIDDSGYAFISTKTTIEQGRYSHTWDGDYWHPPEGDWSFDKEITDLEFEGENITMDMTIQEVIDLICRQTHDCKQFEDEMMSATRDLSDEDFEPDYDDYDD